MKISISFLLAYSISVFSAFSQSFSPQVEEFIRINDSLIAITHVTLVDGKGGPIQENQTLILNKDRIQAIGKTDEVSLPPDATIIDGTGKTVIPGLVMLHEHLFYSKPFENWFSVGQMTFTFPRLYLAGGVTTMRTAGSIQPQTDLNIKKWINEGKMTGPNMDVTGPFIEREGYPIPELGFIEATEEVSKIVNYWADKGVTSFKVYTHITQEDLKVCVEEAHVRGLKVTGHICSVTYGEASDLGIDNLEHGFMTASDFYPNKVEGICDPLKLRTSLSAVPEDNPTIDSLISKLIRNGTAITTTPVVFEPYTGHEIVPGGGLNALAPQVRERVQLGYARRVGKDGSSIDMFNKNLVWLKRFHDRGGLLVAGSDPTGVGRTVAGYANQRTIEILVEAGFSLPEAIKICTFNGAIFLEKTKEIGTLESGKKADLILINGDLRRSIKNIRKMEVVFKGGVGFDSKKMFESVNGNVGLN